MQPQSKGPYRDPSHYTSRSGNLAGPGVSVSREQKRAELSFGVGGGAPPNNPRNADSHTIEMAAMGAQPLENTYRDWRGVAPPLAYQENQPMPPRMAMTMGPPQGAVDTLSNAPTTPLLMGLPPGGGPVSDPPNPIAMSPGISAEQERTRTGYPATGMLPPSTDAGQAMLELSVPFQQMLAMGKGLPPGAMPKKPAGMA